MDRLRDISRGCWDKKRSVGTEQKIPKKVALQSRHFINILLLLYMVIATMAVAALMAIWWVTETIPLAGGTRDLLYRLDGLCTTHLGGNAGDGMAGDTPALQTCREVGRC